MKILLIDALNMFLRSYVVNPSLSPNGDPIGGLVGFMKSLQKHVREAKPDEIIICWDGPGGSKKRRKLNSAYKEGRKPVRLNRDVNILSEEQQKKNQLWQQHKLVELLNETPTVQIMLPEIEADDVIAYICRGTWYSGYKKIIVSNDKDFLQLCDNKTIVDRPVQKKLYNSKRILEEFGIHPNNLALARAIEGDTSDNLPGVPGIKMKTIAKRFPSFAKEQSLLISDLIEEAKGGDQKLKAFANILTHQELIASNYRMMQLYSTLISPQSAEHIREKIDHQERRFNKTNAEKIMFKCGMMDLNWAPMYQEFNRIVWASQVPF